MKKYEDDDEDDYYSFHSELLDLNFPPSQTPESPQRMSRTCEQRIGSRYYSHNFLLIARETLNDRMEIYDEFLSLKKYLKPERYNLSYVKQRIKELFKEYPQLILSYNSFVGKEFQIPLPPEDAPELGTRHERDYRVKNGQQKRNFVPVKECAAQRFYQGAEGTENSECNIYYRGTTKSSQEVVGQNMPPYSRDEYMQKSMEEPNLSNCISCTPSYRILPENYTLPSASQRTDIDDEVLNERCVLFTSQSGDFKHMQKNEYEKTLLLCEDDRFEFDILLELVHSTRACIQELLGKINNSNIDTNYPFCIEDYLSVRHLKFLQRLYGEHWDDVVDKLCKNVHLALSVILSRLKRKQLEWESSRSFYNKVWVETLAKNYQKSLDHRSFDFKQKDSKSLSTKSLVFEIKEISEIQQLEHASVESIIPSSKQLIISHMEFEFPDPEIHEDLYRLIKYSCEEICSSEQADNLMKIWTTFLEPVLGVPHRQKSAADTDKSSYSSVEEQDLSSGGSAITNRNNSDVAGNRDKIQPLAGSQVSFDNGITVDNNDPPRSNDQMGDVCTKAIPSSDQNFPQGSGSLHSCELYMTHFEAEREEGNLSAFRNGELEKFAVSNSGSIETAFNTDEVNRQLGIAYRERMLLDSGEHVSDNDYVESALKISQKASQTVDVSSSDVEDFSSKEPDGEGDGGQMSPRPLNEVVPLALHEEDKNGLIVYGTSSFYVLFRLHQILYERIRKAKLYSSSKENKLRNSSDTKPTELYERLISVIYQLLGGLTDNDEFEDNCRSIIGTQSYLVCTIDKLIYKVVKQLQKISSDEAEMRFIQLHAYEKSRNPGCFTDVIYSANARFMLPDDNIYRIERVSRGSRVSIQLMDYGKDEVIRGMIYGHDKPEHISNFKDYQFTAYINNDLLSVISEETETRGIYLKRNKRKNLRGDETDAQVEALEGVVIVNALDIKISPLTSKPSYIQHSEDFMYRTQKRRATIYRRVTSNAHSANGFPVKQRRCRLFS